MGCIQPKAVIAEFLDYISNCYYSCKILGRLKNQMRKTNHISKFTVVVALVMAIIAFVLGSAAFTPSLVLAVIALPLAIACSYFGVWRLSTITVYWAIAAFITVPISRNLHMEVDTSLVILGVAGLMLSTFLYINYERTKPVG